MAHQIKVVVGAQFKRESVLIDPRVNAGEPTLVTKETRELPDNVIATGTSTRDVLKKAYDR